jgi:nucleotide-binding universal stress UspA family protein
MRTVLAAVDGTPFGEHAMPLAAQIARRAGAELRVIHVFSPRAAPGDDGRLLADARRALDQRRRRGEYLDGLVRRLSRAYPLPVTGVMMDGLDVAETVCEATAAADLLVMATRSRGSWARFWRRRVTAAVARRAECPVLLVRGRDDPPDLDAARLPRDILVPLDATERGEGAVRAAVALGSLAGARYDLMHVVSAWAIGSLSADGYLTPLPGETPEADARSRLLRVAARVAGGGAEATASVVIDDRPVAEAIAGYAERTGAELIALTTRGRGLVSRLFRGSVAEEVACRVSAPVLLTNAREAAGVAAG